MQVLEIQILVLILTEQELLFVESSSQAISNIRDESQFPLLIKICGLTKMRAYIFLLILTSGIRELF